MKIRKGMWVVLIVGIFLLVGITAVVLIGQYFPPRVAAGEVSKALTEPMRKAESNQPGPSVLNQTPVLAPGSTLVPVPTPFAEAGWSQTPPCSSHPVNPEALAKSLSAQAGGGQTTELDFQRAALLSPQLASLKQADVKSLMASRNAEISVYARRTFISLAVNIATGRINRASQVSFASLPGVKTVDDLFTQLEGSLTGQPVSPALLQAAQQVQNGQGLTQPVCARLLTTQSGSQTADLRWAEQSILAQAAPKTPGVVMQSSGGNRPAIDTVTTSPDGRWAAYTSVGNDSGGPVFVLNLASGEWVNLIDRANTALAKDQPKLTPDGWWDVIGWMPDSQRLMIGPSDASAVYLINITSGALTVMPFKGGGNGGAMMVGLTPDGSRFVFVRVSESGDEQMLETYDIQSGKTQSLFKLPYAQGTLYYPRFSPDGQSISYMLQKGRPDTGLTYAIHLFNLAKSSDAVLVEGNLGLSLPTWSPDGRYLAFTKKDTSTPDQLNAAQPLDQPMTNIWVVSAVTGKQQQLTQIQGQALRPRWAPDAKTLSFITHNGEVGLVSLDTPGKIWRAAEPPSGDPNFSNAFFVP